MLNFTPTERRAIITLVLVICSAGIIQLIRPMSVRSEFYDYSPADSVFQRASENFFKDGNNSSILNNKQEYKSNGKVTSFLQNKTNRLPAIGTVDLNLASVVELELLPHIGPAMAKRIVAFRKSNGKFNSLQDLKKVKGIGNKTYESIKPYLQEIK